MSELQKLLNAHIEYESESWKGENLNKNLQLELESLYDCLSLIKAEDLIDKNSIVSFAKKYLTSIEIQDEESNLAFSISESVRSVLDSNKEPLTTLFTKEIFDDSMNLAMGMKELRKDVIRTVIHSPVYTKMISSVMFNAIADFVGGENAFAKNVPVASSLLKIGQDFLGNIPGMQAGIEKNLTSFIQSNLQNSLKQSEKLLNQELDAKTSKELTDEIWNFLQTKKVSDLQQYANAEDLKTILSISRSEWKHIKTSPLLISILESNIEVILKKYKGKKIGELLALYKIPKSEIIENLLLLLETYINKPEIQSHIQARIKLRLEGFYNSETAKKALI